MKRVLVAIANNPKVISKEQNEKNRFRKINKLNKRKRKAKKNEYIKSLASWHGWCKHCNSRILFNKLLKSIDYDIRFN